MNRKAVSEMGNSIPEAIERMVKEGKRILLHQDGKDVAALVTVDDLKFLEELGKEEDRMDLRDARAALAEMVEKGEKPILVEEVGKELGL
jgi:PHD/YefM family antitoxin component YafN of YafNO toxin-antitoxin module